LEYIRHALSLSIHMRGLNPAYPILEEKYGELGRKKCVEDNYHHFKHLDTAYSLNEEKLFVDYALWLNNILTSRGMKEDHLIDNFEGIIKVLHTEQTEEGAIVAPSFSIVLPFCC
jgi:hypothetical protein